MGKVFGLKRQTCKSNLAESPQSLADLVEKKEEDSNMKRKTEQPREHPRAWDYPHGLVGLHNIGQTCCLNSLIQVFVMNMDFTRILKRITVPRGADEQRRSVPFQMLLLLEKMQDSRQKAVRPLELAYCLQKYNVPMFVQHDAAQLYLKLWNLIKDQITDVHLVERLQALYMIRVKDSLICLDCAMESSRNSSMLTLPLSLFDVNSKPLKTLEDALHCFFQPRELSSKSKCFCKNCGKKTRGKQVLKLTHLPQTLTIHLMRFSIRNSQTRKICHALHFPESLDFSQVLPTEREPCDAEEQVGSSRPPGRPASPQMPHPFHFPFLHPQSARSHLFLRDCRHPLKTFFFVNIGFVFMCLTALRDGIQNSVGSFGNNVEYIEMHRQTCHYGFLVPTKLSSSNGLCPL
ncbi:ubl carboxyl-terminal hydrolase 18 isoform X1 [Papio anubis]|uniref:ubl carboxyl-terminal hydrolase 18 isoform X1 n=1 Tax=Papio anubis TaxID=9555 RepID=UPI0012AD9D30|nr:ubl carboxyl-terminal hydrolase 18 isoform X1 [Papio anubis]XP_021777042.2 ubl carboxyl-terminal hydrolase 18 isoform X1 [Papio anubis]